jgi:hypothetical protein
MKHTSGLALATTLLLATAGCDQGDTNASNPAKIVVGQDNPYQKKLLALNETDRMLALRRAVQDDGNSCRKIDGSRFQQDYKGMAMWVAYCSSGAFAVYLAPDSQVQVRPCKDSATLGLPECVPAPEYPNAASWPKAAEPVRPAPGPTG